MKIKNCENSILMQRVVLSCALLIIVLCTRADAVLPPKFGGVLRVALPAKVSRIDPTKATADHEFMLASCIFETLVTTGAGGGLVPVLLEELPVESDDGLKYYFMLKEDIAFHDGTMLDSADIVHSFRELAADTHSPYAWILADIEGVEDYRGGRSRTIEGIKITDRRRFEITLTRRNPDFVTYLTFPAASIIPTSDRRYEPPVGTGPFIFFDRSQRGDITLVANKDYRLGRPYIDSIEFKVIQDSRERFTAFKAGELDIVDAPFGGVSDEDQELFGKPVSGNMKRLFFLDVNPGFIALRTHNNRAALSAAIDRAGIVKAIMNGTAAPAENIKGGKGGEKLKEEAHSAGQQLVLWHQEGAHEISLAAEKIAFDLSRMNLSVTPQERSLQGLISFSIEDAPAMVLRSLPVLSGLDDSVDRVVFAGEYSSRQAAMALKLDLLEGSPEGSEKSCILHLFLRRPAYLSNKNLHNFTTGAQGEPLLDDVYIREEKSQIERLDN